MTVVSRNLSRATAATRFYQLFFSWSSCRSTHTTTFARSLSTQTHAALRHLSRPAVYAAAPTILRRNASTDSDSSSESPTQSLSAHVRTLMRRVPHPVVVITTTVPSTTDGAPVESTFRGMTLSSFNTVTLEPTPLVSFNVRVPSATYDALREGGGHFLAHLLRGGPAGARVATSFTRGYREGTPFAELDNVGDVRVFVAKEEKGKEGDRSPLLVGEGVGRVLRCKILPGKELQAGDHVIMLGEVVGVVGSAEDRLAGMVDKGPMGLMYADRGYKKVGEDIVFEEPDDAEGHELRKSETVNMSKNLEGVGN